jgi:hypothetical protein
MARRHLRGLGALFDPNKPVSSSFAAGDTSAVIANFLGTDRGSDRTVYGGCPKGVKDEAEAASKCQYFSTRGSLETRNMIVADRTNPAFVTVRPGRLGADKAQRGLANALLRALGAGVQVEDKTLLSSKSRKLGAAVLSTAGGGRVMISSELTVPVTNEIVRRANAANKTGAGLTDIASGFDQTFIDEVVKSRSSGKKRRRKSRR